MKDIETGKYIVDAASVSVVAGTLLQWLPSVAAVFSIVWMAIRIWETKTCRWWLRRWRK